MIAQADRISFSSYQVLAPTQIAGIQQAQASLASRIVSAQALDTANDNLFTPVNTLVNQYQAEYNYIDGNSRTAITEQNITDSANKVLNNFFFPNNTSNPVTPLAPNNIWTQTMPFALSAAIGLPYSGTLQTQYTFTVTALTTATPVGSVYTNNSQTFTVIISAAVGATSLVTSGTGAPAGSGNLTHSSGGGQSPTIAFSASASGELPLITTILGYTSMTDPSVISATVSTYLATLSSELAALNANTDTNPMNQTNNATAITNINTTVAALNSYSSLAQLQSDVTTRQTFLTDPTNGRVAQLNAILGSITQNLTNGTITASSGFYGQRYSYLNLRLNALNGSLTILASLQAANNALSANIANIQSTAATYFSILPTSAFQSNANGTQFIALLNVSFLSPGDTVYVMADNQTELQFAVKTIVGNAVTLNAAVPSKYTTTSNIRLYKDLT